MSEPWKDLVRQRLIDLNVNQNDFAEWVGCVQSQISHMLSSDRARRSNYVERVSIAVGVPLPDPARIEVAVMRLVELRATGRLAKLVELAEQYAAANGGDNGDSNSPPGDPGLPVNRG